MYRTKNLAYTNLLLTKELQGRNWSDVKLILDDNWEQMCQGYPQCAGWAKKVVTWPWLRVRVREADSRRCRCNNALGSYVIFSRDRSRLNPDSLLKNIHLFVFYTIFFYYWCGGSPGTQNIKCVVQNESKVFGVLCWDYKRIRFAPNSGWAFPEPVITYKSNFLWKGHFSTVHFY